MIKGKKWSSNSDSFNSSTLHTLSSHIENKSIPTTNITLFSSTNSIQSNDKSTNQPIKPSHNHEQTRWKRTFNTKHEIAGDNNKNNKISKHVETIKLPRCIKQNFSQWSLVGKSAASSRLTNNKDKNEYPLSNKTGRTPLNNKIIVQVQSSKALNINSKIKNHFKINEVKRPLIPQKQEMQSKINKIINLNLNNKNTKECPNKPDKPRPPAEVAKKSNDDELLEVKIIHSKRPFASIVLSPSNNQRNVALRKLRESSDKINKKDDETKKKGLITKKMNKNENSKHNQKMNKFIKSMKISVALGQPPSNEATQKQKFKRSEVSNVNDKNIENNDEFNDKIDDSFVGIQLPAAQIFQVEKPVNKELKFRKLSSFTLWEEEVEDDCDGNGNGDNADPHPGKELNWSKVIIGNIDAYDDIIEKDKSHFFQSPSSMDSFDFGEDKCTRIKAESIEMLEEVCRIWDWEEGKDQMESDEKTIDINEMNENTEITVCETTKEWSRLVPNYIAKVLFRRKIDDG